MLRRLGLLACTLLLGCVHARTPSPEDLDAAIAELDATLDADSIEFFDVVERADLGELHHGFGTSLRNRWGLWSGGRLARWFRRHGVSHPDSMSSVIIDAYWMHRHGEHLELSRVTWAQRMARRRAARRSADKWAAEDKAEQEKYERGHQAWLDEIDAAMRRAMMGWTKVAKKVPLVRPPAHGDVPSVGKIERIDEGFVVAFDEGPWGYGPNLVFRVRTSDAELDHLEPEGCAEVHDVAATGDALFIVCRDAERWRLLTEVAGEVRREALPLDASFVRLGLDGTEPFLFDERNVYARSPAGTWEASYVPTHHRLLPFRTAEDPFRSMPGAGDTAIRVGDFLYMRATNAWGSGDVWRLDVRDPKRPPDGLVASLPLYGFPDAIALVPARAGGFWVTFADSTLVRYHDSDAQIGVLLGSVEYPYVRKRETLRPDEGRQRVPARAVWEDDDGLWLAGPGGIARVRDERVEPIVAFSRSRADDLEPRVMARFDDGTFLLGDRYAGLFRVATDGSQASVELLDLE